ncbi:hypothetical protein [Aeromonas veronii]|uniref:hypothetical protein n=1 Tax=Aeromonas veronii TaxID=654 RepID=UPI003DA2B5ED
MSQQQNNDMLQHFYRASAADFGKIPGSPVAYWLEKSLLKAFSDGCAIGDLSETAVGLFTCNNDYFLKHWHEVDVEKISFNCSNRNDTDKFKYYPYNKGGGFRKWYGLNNLVVNYQHDGQEVRDYRKESGQSWSLPGEKYYFSSGITWSGLTSSINSFRYSPIGYIFESNKGQMLFSNTNDYLIAFLNSGLCQKIISVINPTLSLQSNEIKKIPIIFSQDKLAIESKSVRMFELSKNDWDSFESSWDFIRFSLLDAGYLLLSLKDAYKKRSYKMV